jgi:hypothetical protein
LDKLVPEIRSPLQTIALVCSMLDQGTSEEKVRADLDLHDDNLFSFCIEFALENNFIIKLENGKYTITNSGREFGSAFLS